MNNLKKLVLAGTLGLAFLTNSLAQEIVGVRRRIENKTIVIEVLMKEAYKKWLGCTIFPESEEARAWYGDNIDLEAKLITKNNKVNYKTENGLEERYITYFKWQPMIVGSYSGTVALWNKKVSKRECANQRGGSPCEYCIKNGYHLEEELDREYFNPIEVNIDF